MACADHDEEALWHFVSGAFLETVMRTHSLIAGVLSILLFCGGAPHALAADASQLYSAGRQASEEHHHAEALQWFKAAALQGHRDAQLNSGLMLLYGPRLYGAEVETDPVQALALLRAAAEAGCEISAYMLTRMRGNQGCL